MRKPILIIQHLACEPAALIGEVLWTSGRPLETVISSEQGLPESLDDYAGLVIMGGPMSANDELPYITAEIKLLQEAIRRNLPYIGVCLGAQLLARAAGARVYRAPVRELGWYTLSPTPAAASDTLFSHLPATGLPVFQWHGETFDLPEGATLLATCPAVPHQAFRIGKALYGLQFHVEVDETIIRDWVDTCADERRHLGPQGVTYVLEATPRHLAAMQAFCRTMTTEWSKLLSA